MHIHCDHLIVEFIAKHSVTIFKIYFEKVIKIVIKNSIKIIYVLVIKLKSCVICCEFFFKLICFMHSLNSAKLNI